MKCHVFRIIITAQTGHELQGHVFIAIFDFIISYNFLIIKMITQIAFFLCPQGLVPLSWNTVVNKPSLKTANQRLKPMVRHLITPGCSMSICSSNQCSVSVSLFGGDSTCWMSLRAIRSSKATTWSVNTVCWCKVVSWAAQALKEKLRDNQHISLVFKAFECNQ